MSEQVLTIIAGSVLSILGFLIRSVLKSIDKDIKTLASEVHHLRGSFEPIQRDLKDCTIEMVKVRSELNAVWRYIDAKPRASDKPLNSHHG